MKVLRCETWNILSTMELEITECARSMNKFKFGSYIEYLSKCMLITMERKSLFLCVLCDFNSSRLVLSHPPIKDLTLTQSLHTRA